MARKRRASQFDYFTAWWRGDAIHGAFAKTVDKLLRQMAFETRKRARARLIRRHYWKMRTTGKRNIRQVRVREKRYTKFTYSTWRVTPGGSVRSQGRRRKYAPSKPGESPTNQTNTLKASILYDFKDSPTRIETYIGAISLPKSEHWSFTGGLASHALEYGGTTVNHGGKKVQIAARPFMRPAQQDLLNSRLIQKALGNSLSRELARTGTSGGRFL